MQAFWDANASYVRAMLSDVETQAHVGLHGWERHPERPARLLVNVEMFAHGAAFLDYDPVRAALLAWPGRPHTDLLETLAEEIVAVCFANPLVEACRVSVVKPDIFNEAAAAGIEFYRLRSA